MRIIAGEWRGRRLVAPAGDATRPTADRTREALFSMLTSRLGSFEGLRVADLFAGSGAGGLEALSRGAAECVFVERDRAALDAIRANVAALGAGKRAMVLGGDVLTLPCRASAPDLILLDPPYGQGLADAALAHLLTTGWVGPATWLAIETGRSEALAAEGYDRVVDRAVGRATVVLLRPANSPPLNGREEAVRHLAPTPLVP